MTNAEFRAARISFGLTQAAWGRMLGIGREYVAKIETGRVPVSSTIALLVEAYQRHGLPVTDCNNS
jgi:DNA-binding XRE family transcriptional regulator